LLIWDFIHHTLARLSSARDCARYIFGSHQRLSRPFDHSCTIRTKLLLNVNSVVLVAGSYMAAATRRGLPEASSCIVFTKQHPVPLLLQRHHSLLRAAKRPGICFMMSAKAACPGFFLLIQSKDATLFLINEK
jgi:hypothetical protein